MNIKINDSDGVSNITDKVVSMGIEQYHSETINLAIKNVEIIKELLPDWVCVFYVPESLDDGAVKLLEDTGSQVRKTDNKFPPLWKYLIMGDNTTNQYIIRDVNTLFTVLDKVIIDEWCASDMKFFFKRSETLTQHNPLFIGGFTHSSLEFYNHLRIWFDNEKPSSLSDYEYFDAHMHHHLKSSAINCVYDIDTKREKFIYPKLHDDEKLNFITVMNGYNSADDVIMCKGWFHFVRKYHPTDNIIVYHHEQMHPELIRDDVEYKKLDITGIPVVAGFTHKRVKLAVHREWSKYEHFIFMDADAYPLRSMREMFNNCRIPVTICGHDWDYNLLNSGVFVQRKNIFNHEDLITVFNENNRRVKYPGTDQALVRMYFDKIGYNPHDYEVMNQEYNSNSNVESIDIVDGEVIAISQYTHRRLNVIHGYGGFKFQKYDKTKEFWEHIKKILVLESLGEEN